MIPVDEVEALLNQMATRRLRFETIVDDLLSNGLIARTGLVIQPEASSAYQFERDVLTVTNRAGDQTEPRWQVTIPRDGFYDTLPERLFHRAKKRTKDEDEWAEIRQKEEKQEQESRHFFLPFDNAFNHQKVKIAQFETNTLSGDDDQLLTDLLHVMAPEIHTKTLTMSQKLTLFLIIIGAWQTVGNWEQTAACFSQFLGVPVQVRFGWQAGSGMPAPMPVATWNPARLGSGRVGIDFVLTQPPNATLGGRIHLLIGPLTNSQLTHYLPGGVGLQQVRMLADYLLPAEADYTIQPLANPAATAFRLSKEATTGRLGMTTELP
ncbi:type VI secretion system baseplate subunit TssG [Fibrella aquatilis]|uniref:Type VI secretion system baseplate subunit TssG n=1 Tax=Fibrella aquatilis TaxID=2817059 RepID=A0A939K0X4_9BACT|nr:type VI secretion system baseplate subunit TssG [Fibrella aquatilis]MBO0932456.1 type VI secretion system baseplate subunit TssG [Fibrella aquatilis]